MMNELADFEPYVGKSLKAKLQSGQETELKLVEVRALPTESDDIPDGVRKSPFLLFLHGPLDAFHQSGCLEVTFGDQGSIALGMYAESKDDEKFVYSALFN